MCTSMLSCFSHVWLFATPWTMCVCVCVCVFCVLCLVTQLCLTLCDLVDCSSPGPSVHGILQARTFEWVAIPSSRESFWLRDRTWVSYVSCIGMQVLYHFFTWEAPVLLRGTINYCKKLNSKIKINRIIIALLFLFSRSVMSDSFQPHELQHNRLPCPSLSPRDCSNSGPLNQWCHPTSSASVVPFFSCLQSFPASGYFPVSRLFTSSGQRIGVSASASILPMNIQHWFSCYLRDSQESFQHHSSKALILWHSAFFIVQLSTSTYDYWKSNSFD